MSARLSRRCRAVRSAAHVGVFSFESPRRVLAALSTLPSQPPGDSRGDFFLAQGDPSPRQTLWRVWGGWARPGHGSV